MAGQITPTSSSLSLGMAGQSSQQGAAKQIGELKKDAYCLKSELQQVRVDRDHQLERIQRMSVELKKYAELNEKSSKDIDIALTKASALEETCSSQQDQIKSLHYQLTNANEKLKRADLTMTEIVQENKVKLAEAEKLRKKLHNTIMELKGNIRVFCRVRPVLPDSDCSGVDETIVSYPTGVEYLGRGIDLIHNAQKYSFTFDKVFDHEASQKDVFFEISQLVQSALDGYKVCIFAYGQTGSGKTYTMMGKPEGHEQKGLIPRSLEQIFETSQTLKCQGWKYKMQVSTLEIYNETIRDLLCPSRCSSTDATHVNKQCTIKHDSAGNSFVSDLTVVDVCSLKEVSFHLNQAAQSRSVGKTQINEQSSRSHFVFTLRISGMNDATEQQVQGVLNLIDLAGSERLTKSGSTGDRLKETQAINKSLSSLSDVIFKLAKKEVHVPFRNSKLTHLLQPCLGGDSKTLLFVNISPEASSINESICSLRFAARVNLCEIGVPRRHTRTKPLDSKSIYGFEGHDGRVKKPTASPCWSKKRKLINVASPLAKNQKPENLSNEEQSVDIPPTIDIMLSHSSEGYSTECYEDYKQGPSLSNKLREISDRYKNFNSQCISLCKSDMLESFSKQFTDDVELKTPILHYDSKMKSFATPHEKFKTRSTGLKKSLVDECLDFLNCAGKDELKQLKGIGEKRSTCILELREESSEHFKEVDDLKGLGLSSKQIKGMISKMLEDI